MMIEEKTSCDSQRRIRHRLIAKSVFNTRILCLDSSLRSRMTSRYLMPFCKNRLFVSAHTRPFRRLRRHLSQGKASHSLLQRRSAPRKAIRLLPVIRGRLTFPILFFMYSFSIRISWQSNSSLPSFLSGGNQKRWQANCIFRSGATRKCNETPYPTNGSGKNPARDIHKCVYKNNKKYNFLFPQCQLPPNTGGSAEPARRQGQA